MTEPITMSMPLTGGSGRRPAPMVEHIPGAVFVSGIRSHTRRVRRADGSARVVPVSAGRPHVRVLPAARPESSDREPFQPGLFYKRGEIVDVFA